MNLLASLAMVACLVRSHAQETEWRQFSVGPMITVEMPGDAMPYGLRGTQAADNVGGLRLTQDQITYDVLCSDREGSEKIPLDAFMTIALARFAAGKLELLNECKCLTMDGWPAIQMTIFDGTTYTSRRTIKADSRFINLTGMYKIPGDRKKIDRFLDSVKFLESLGKGTEEANWPKLEKRSLGSLGVTAFFPKEPKESEDQVTVRGFTSSVHQYTCIYGFLRFGVVCIEVPHFVKAPSGQEMMDLTPNIEGSLEHHNKAYDIHSDSCQWNGLSAQRIQNRYSNGFAGSELVAYKRRLIVEAYVDGPQPMMDAAVVKQFFDSVKF